LKKTRWRKYHITWREKGRTRSAVISARSAAEARKFAPTTSTKIRALGGISPPLPAVLAEFYVGRGVGLPIGEYVSHEGRSCLIGKPLHRVPEAVQNGIISEGHAKGFFMATRIKQLHSDVGSAGGSVMPSWGMYKGGEEPGFKGEIMWTPNKVEPTPEKFEINMQRMCEVLACGLAQKEVFLRYSSPRGTALRRCSPTGTPWPYK
jgi:hypothetical protein